jgi:hypothetical protein
MHNITYFDPSILAATIFIADAWQLITYNFTYLSGFEFVWQFGMGLACSYLVIRKRE